VSKKRHLIAAAALASVAIASAAKAATDMLSLTGKVADSTYGTITVGGVVYNTWTLPLSGLDPVNGLTVSQGDTVDGTIDLDETFTIDIPDSSNIAALDVILSGSFFQERIQPQVLQPFSMVFLRSHRQERAVTIHMDWPLAVDCSARRRLPLIRLGSTTT
jgi:hypothetical protein